MKVDVQAYQTHWHSDELLGIMPRTLDAYLLFGWWDRFVQESAGAGKGGGRVLDVACGDARDIASMSHAGWEGWGLDPSPLQLRDARKTALEGGMRINLVQGVAEWLPFKEGVFDSLICKSALDHLVDREGTMREFVRVLHPEGRAVVSINNYGGFTIRVSRWLYWIFRAVWPPARSKLLLWDSPVPRFHSWEYTFHNTRALGEPYFRVVRTYGVSLLFGFPGWGRFLSFLPVRFGTILVSGLDKLARRVPRLADVAVFVWQPAVAAEESVAVEEQG